MIAARLKPSCFAFRLFSLLVSDDLLDRSDVARPLLAETFEIKSFDEFRKGHFPRLLMMIRLLTEFLRIQAQLPCHLNVGMGEVKSIACIDPDLMIR